MLPNGDGQFFDHSSVFTFDNSSRLFLITATYLYY